LKSNLCSENVHSGSFAALTISGLVHENAMQLFRTVRTRALASLFFQVNLQFTNGDKINQDVSGIANLILKS
jgi:hypothetical protein